MAPHKRRRATSSLAQSGPLGELETGEQALPPNGGRSVASEMVEPGVPAGADRDWHSLTSNPDYAPVWREHGATASIMASSGSPLCTQSKADPGAAQWALLASEDPRTRSRLWSFCVHNKTGRTLPVKPLESAPVVAVLARETGIRLTGLLHRGGTFVLEAKRERRAEQRRIIEGKSFDFDRTDLELEYSFGGFLYTAMPRITNLAIMIDPRGCGLIPPQSTWAARAARCG